MQSVSGRGGIRTLDSPEAIPVFETGRFNHSRTLPNFGVIALKRYGNRV